MDLKSLSGKTKTIYTCIIFSLCLFWSHIYRNKTLFTGVLDKLFEYWWNYLFLYIFWIKLGFPPLCTPSTFVITIDRFFDFDRPLTHLRANTGDSFAELQRFQKTEGNWKGNEWRFVNSDVFIRNSMLTQQLQLPGEVPPSISNAFFWFSSLWWGIYRKWKPDTEIWHAHICRYQIINIVSIFSRR